MADPVSAFLDIIFQNIWIIVIIVGVAVFFWLFTTFRNKTRVIKRSDIERQEMIKRLKPNKSYLFKWLFHGYNLVGSIKAFRFITYKSGKVSTFMPKTDGKKYEFIRDFGENKAGDILTITPKDKDYADLVALLLGAGAIAPVKETGEETPETFIQMLVQPVFHEFIKFPNIFAPLRIFQINLNDGIKMDRALGSVTIPENVAFDEFMGVNYDMTTLNHINIINDQLLRTDFNSLASIYFVKSQEQSTYNPDNAHEMAMKQRELEIEMAKRKGKMTTI